MADTFWSVSVGEQMPHQVTVGTSTSGEAIELRVVQGASINKLTILNALETLENYISQNSAPA
jgi:hypothetical protein